ncbi:hypothetical protein BCL80_107157 [Streptomyces avidinii]|nr:hypothetical protein BCL80_107157 [Streptomyces avidinii]SNX78560.1 hypothetical protein SAMN05421860_106359 [Streptomyces microflavus]
MITRTVPGYAPGVRIRDITLWVLKENVRARRFYERAGFRPDGAEETFEAGGARVPEVRYTRPLTPPAAV